MSTNLDENLDNDDDDDDDDQQQAVKTKIIKCKTNNQQAQTSAYNISLPNGSSPKSIRSIDVPNEHAAIKLHIRRVCSPSSSESSSTTMNKDSLELPSATTKIISRQFFNSNEIPTEKNSRRFISTRRTSSVDTEHYQSSSMIYDLPKTTLHNQLNIHDENTLKKPTTKRKSVNESQEKKRTKLTSRTIIKQPTNPNPSKIFCFQRIVR